MRRIRRDAPFPRRALVHRQNAPALGAGAKDAQNPPRVGADPPDQAALIGVILTAHGLQPRQDAVALAQGRVGGAQDQQHPRLRPLALPFQRARIKVPVRRRRDHLQNRDRRQLVGVAIGLPPLFKMPVFFKLLQQPLQVDPVRALDTERLRDIALGGQRGVRGDPVEDLLF